MNPASLQDVLALAFREALAWRDAEDDAPVAAQASFASLYDRLHVALDDRGLDPCVVLDDLVAATRGGLHKGTGGRFFGWVVGGSLPASLGADWLTSAWDQNAGAFAVAPAASVAEQVAGSWLLDLLGLPASCSFALVTGCQMAHTTCLAAARHHLLALRGWDVERQGLFGAPPLRLLTSTEAHGTLARSARLLGLGTGSLTHLPAGPDGRLLEAALQHALESATGQPTIVVLQASDLHTGAFDDYRRLIPLAHEHNAWVHVDGAFGLWLAGSPRFRPLLAGVEAADSWATDGHKWLNVPYDCGYAIVRHPEPHRAAFAYHSSYVEGGERLSSSLPGSAAPYPPPRDPLDWTPEWSRRARGFSTYAALRELGRDGVAALIDRCCDAAHALTLAVGALPGAELLSEPTSNQGMVRFLHPTPGSAAGPDTGPDTAHDAFTDRVTAAILASGEALFSNTTWRGRRAMRISVCGWKTTPAEVDRTVAAVASILEHERAAIIAARTGAES